MKKTTLAIIIAILSVGALAGVYFFNIKEPSTSTTPSINSQDASDTFTTAEVAKHDAADDCWTIIEDNVYDLTSYIPNHPGGVEDIVMACGTDGTSLFTERKTTDGDKVGSGKPHSASAESQLAKLKIGVIEK